MVISHVFRLYTEGEENDLLHMLMKAIEIWGYLMFCCYLQFYLMIQTEDDRQEISNESLKVQYINYWILVEVLVFYGRIFNSVIFLFYIQLRGQFGFKDDEENEDRFKYDALDYYEVDINWTSYQTVPIMLMTNFLWRVDVQADLTINLHAKYMISVLIGQRLVQFFIMSPFRRQDHFIEKHESIKWVALAIMELCALQLFFMQSAISPASPLFVFDLCLLILQYFYHRESIRE